MTTSINSGQISARESPTPRDNGHHEIWGAGSNEDPSGYVLSIGKHRHGQLDDWMTRKAVSGSVENQESIPSLLTTEPI